jgi:hypothetical protein
VEGGMRVSASWFLSVVGIVVSIATPAQADPTYWNVFNIEGESAISADIVTYGSLTDMLNDTNRLGVFTAR